MDECDFNNTDNVSLTLNTSTMFYWTDVVLSGGKTAVTLQPVKTNKTHLTLFTMMSFQSVRAEVLGVKLSLENKVPQNVPMEIKKADAQKNIDQNLMHWIKKINEQTCSTFLK